jgi:hypothetical protein
VAQATQPLAVLPALASFLLVLLVFALAVSLPLLASVTD